MEGRKTNYVPADMSISVVEDEEKEENVDDDDVTTFGHAAASTSIWVNPNSTMIGGHRPSHETSWLHGSGDASFMERVDLRGKLREAELKLYRAETENIRLKNDLERRDSVIRCLQSRAQENVQTSVTQLRGEKRKSDAAKNDADNWRRKLQERENEIVTLRKEKSEAVSKVERQLREKDRLLVQKDDELIELKRTSRELRRADEARKFEFEEMQRELAELREANMNARVGNTTAKFDQAKKTQLLEAELRETNLKLSEAQQALKDMDDMKKLEKVFYTKLTDVPALLLENEQLKRENALFRQGSEKVLVLEAQNVDLKEEVEGLKDRLAEFADLSAQKALADSRLAAWEAFAGELLPDLRYVDKDGELGPEISPHHVAAAVAHFQDESLALAQKSGSLQTDLNVIKVQLSAERGAKAAAQTELSSVKEELEIVRRRMTAAVKQKHLLTLDRDSCRRLLDSFQDDITTILRPKDDRTAELEVIAEEYKKEVERLSAELQNLESRSVAAKADVSNTSGDITAAEVADELRSHVEKLEAANEGLSREIANWRGAVTSLRANVADLETRLQFTESSRVELGNELVVVRSQVSAFSRKASRRPWDEDDDKMRAAEVETLRREVADLRKQRAEALSDQLKTVERFRALLKKKEDCDEEKTKLEAMATSLKTALAEADEALSEAFQHERSIENDLNMSKTEVETLKSCVEDMGAVQRDTEARERELAAERDALSEEVQKLEEQVTSLKAELERAEEEKASVEEQFRQESDRATELKAEFERVEVELASLSEELNREKDQTDALRAEVDRMEVELQRASTEEKKERTTEMEVDENASSAKKEDVAEEAQPGPSDKEEGGEVVVRLRDNPLVWQRQEREKEFEMLKAEVESLRRKLAAAGSSAESGAAALDVTTVAKEDEYSYKKIRDLQAALKRTETMNERLRKSWRETSQKFRELVYQFSGYKVDKIGPDDFKLTSMYAESPEDYFLFRRNNEGLLEFLGSDFVDANKTSFECYLTKRNSIPGFLASVTLDLLARETE